MGFARWKCEHGRVCELRRDGHLRDEGNGIWNGLDGTTSAWTGYEAWAQDACRRESKSES